MSKVKLVRISIVVLSLLHLFTIAAFSQATDEFTEGSTYRITAGKAQINSETTKIVSDSRLVSNKGIALKPDIPTAVEGERPKPDIVFDVKAPTAGRYVMHTYAETNDETAKVMKEASSKWESLFMKLQIGDRPPTKRVVYVPWIRPRQETGIFTLSGSDQQIKIWLPKGVRLGYVELKKYQPVPVPTQAQGYEPEITPPNSHPRLWVNEQSLPEVRGRLKTGENLEAWKKVKELADKPFEFDPKKGKKIQGTHDQITYNQKVEKAAKYKAFYYLMTGKKEAGREAIQIMTDYLPKVEYGNVLDITRQRGSAIYNASLVYDWCYSLLNERQQKLLRDNMMRLSRRMEVGWPPFRQSITMGHGAEAQINRDLLSMSIAIYDEDPLAYEYTSYRILEELLPMRRFEYQSPRYNQGVNYGRFRFGWEMTAAWLLYRMNGHPVFDNNIKGIRKYWQYMRLPDESMFPDGDGNPRGANPKAYDWKYQQTALLNYAYAGDPILKGEFEREGGLPNNPILFLLLNDPALEAQKSRDSLPLTKDFGPILGSMVARTGWDRGIKSNDVVAEIKGGGYRFGNHQHADAGALQIYYRGLQVGDLGIYGFYGTPYDYNFNKRSIAHSMMLARDPQEQFGDGHYEAEANDGGTRFVQGHPKSPKEVKTDPKFNRGTVLSTDFGPSKQQPSYSYFKADLTAAYTSKMSNYSRGFCFLNLDKEKVPAAIILSDDMTTSKPEFEKYWQVNTLNTPVETDTSIILHNQRGGMVGKTHVNMLVPSATNRQTTILSGSKANSVFGHQYEPPSSKLPEASGTRIMISPKKANKRDRFLTVFQMTAGDTNPLPVTHHKTEESNVVILADRVVSMSKDSGLISSAYTLNIPANNKYQVLLAGMKPGFWNVHSQNGNINFNIEVTKGENTIFFRADGGKYIITPGRKYGVQTR